MNSHLIVLTRGAVGKFDWIDLKIDYENQNGHYGGGATLKWLLTATVNDGRRVATNWTCDVEFSHICYNNGNRQPEPSVVAHLDVHNHFHRFDHRHCCNGYGTYACLVRLDSGRKTTKEQEKQFTDASTAAAFNANCQLTFADSTQPVFVNRELLAVYCTVFRSMFTGDYLEKRAELVPLRDVKKAEFLVFLRCLYHPVAPVTRESLPVVLKLADQFDCRVLLDECEQFLKNNLPQTAADYKQYVELSDRFSFKELLASALATVPDHILPEFLNPQWLEKLNQTTITTIHSKTYETFRSMQFNKKN